MEGNALVTTGIEINFLMTYCSHTLTAIKKRTYVISWYPPVQRSKKGKLKVMVLPIQATKALRVGTGTALPYLRPRHWRWGWGSAPRPGRFSLREKTRYPLYRRLGGPQGRSGMVRKISLPTGIRSPDRPARSQSLYRLSYPGRQKRESSHDKSDSF